VFFSHDKSTNSIFNHLFSARALLVSILRNTVGQLQNAESSLSEKTARKYVGESLMASSRAVRRQLNV
jgi:hypothetical protein